MSTTVYIPEKYRDLADRLAQRATSEGEKPIFATRMDVMVFAAMIGYSLGEMDEVPTSERGHEVYSHIFERRDMDGVAYLLAVHQENAGDILRDEREGECWGVIQGYAARGMREIESWLVDAATDVDGVTTLLNRLKDVAGRNPTDLGEALTPDPEW